MLHVATRLALQTKTTPSTARISCFSGTRPNSSITIKHWLGTSSSHTHGNKCNHSHTLVTTAIEHAAELLPHQGILENFIHHNPLSHLESLPFKEALDHVQKLESYMSPGERVFSIVHVDPRKRVNEALVELSSAFLDRGAAKWAPQFRDKGFLYFFASLESLGFAPWRKHARTTATCILAKLEHQQRDNNSNATESPIMLAESIIQENLEFFGIPRGEWPDAIRSMLMELRGWAGMFQRMESRPSEAPANTAVRMVEFAAVQSILYRSSIEALASQYGWDSSAESFDLWLRSKAVRSTSQTPKHQATAAHTSAIAYVDQSAERRDVLETEFKHTLLNAISAAGNKSASSTSAPRPTLQLYTCIDDRECSFRRHVEDANPSEIETFGVAGFFGIPICYQPADGREQMVLAPEGNNPSAILVEHEHSTNLEQSAKFNRRRRFLARAGLMCENASFSPTGSLLLSTFLLPFSIARLLLVGFAPATKQALEDSLRHKFLTKPQTDFHLPMPPDQAATLLARTFKDLGTHKRFAPIVVVLGHGAISVNNPFAAAYNCGACGGREGGPNARLLSRLANNQEVRLHLKKDYDISIPDDTVFVGGLHNTTTDTVEFYDLSLLPESHRERFAGVQRVIARALGKNALERCHRFLLAKDVRTPEAALHHVHLRATDLAEVRPELNHATNAAVVVGRRDLTKGRFLDRRVFLPSYDPFSDDAVGTNLEHVLAPALIVCSGINLEYLFSTVAVEHHGAGTKAPLNIIGNIGVLQGTAGDLRPGLPSQMTEMHTPVRALFVVDAPIERVEAVLSRREQLRHLVRNDWVRLFVRDPKTGRFYRQTNGQYLPLDPKESAEVVPFINHRRHGMNVARREAMNYWAATVGMILATGVPIYMFGAQAMNPYGPLIALSGMLLSLPVLAFSRRYLHGEFMFGRFAALCTGLLLGFNLVATAPTLMHALAGWSLFGFSSTFLIGAYNDRPTVRNNATFAFAAYKISDLAMLVAATFSAHHGHHAAAAAGLLLAALFKSSQFPLTSLFVRSMEGPTPASALGYAGLSAHVGVVLLTSTMPLWFGFDWARVVLGSIGFLTAGYATLVAKIRSDRKGALARATSATIGLIFVTLALGHPDLALLMSLGHAAFRMLQVLRAPNMITDTQNLRSALGRTPWPKLVPDWLYRLSWALRRVDTDFHLMNLLHRLSRYVHMPKLLQRSGLSKYQQWIVTAVGVVLAGAPFTPFSHSLEELLMELLPTHPLLAGTLMFGHFGVSVILIRFLLLKVLDSQRFHKKHHQ